jgi:lipoprotein-releasing system permease protein
LISTLEKEITFRYLKTRKKDGFLNIISIFSFIGISLGVAVLIIVMSVMNGFRTELISRIVGFNAHVTVKPYDKSINLEKLNDKNLKLISKELIFSNSGEAIVISKDYTKGLVLRGYNSKDFQKLDVVKKGNLIGNSNLLTKNQISIGKELSFNLKLELGDKISIMSPSGIDTIIGSFPRQETFVVSSIFDSGLADFDANIAFINLTKLENFLGFQKEDRNIS